MLLTCSFTQILCISEQIWPSVLLLYYLWPESHGSKVEVPYKQTTFHRHFILTLAKLYLPSHVKWKCGAEFKLIFLLIFKPTTSPHLLWMNVSWCQVSRPPTPNKPDLHHQLRKLSLTEEGQNENEWGTNTIFFNTAVMNSALHSAIFGHFESFFMLLIVVYLSPGLCDCMAFLQSWSLYGLYSFNLFPEEKYLIHFWRQGVTQMQRLRPAYHL